MKNYIKNLELFDYTKFNNYVHKDFILKCYDENKKQTHILFQIYYAHCTYRIDISGLEVKETEKGGKIYSYYKGEPLQFTMYETTYKYSKKQMEKTVEFLKINFDNIIETYMKLNKNIYVE